MANLNRIDFLESAIKSYQGLSIPKELIVIDGKSSDGSDKFLQRHADIFESSRDCSVYEAWNKGIQRATGEWIFFFNTDDILLEGYKHVYSHLLNVKDFEIAKFGIDIERLGSKITHKNIYPTPTFRNIISNPIYFNGYIFRRTVFNKLGNFDLNFRFCADQDFLWKCIQHNYKIHTIPHTAYRYRVHSESLTLSSSVNLHSEELNIAIKRNLYSINSRDRHMSSIWIEWEKVSLDHRTKAMRLLFRLFKRKTFVQQIYFIIKLIIDSPVARFFH